MEAPEEAVVALAYARSYLPNATLAWLGGELRGTHSLDAFRHVDGEDRILFVLSTAVEGVLVPQVVSLYPHIPYDTAFANARPPRSELNGVFAWVEPVYSPTATELRFAMGRSLRQTAVREGHTLVVQWDTSWQSRELWRNLGDDDVRKAAYRGR